MVTVVWLVAMMVVVVGLVVVSAVGVRESFSPLPPYRLSCSKQQQGATTNNNVRKQTTTIKETTAHTTIKQFGYLRREPSCLFIYFKY